MSGIHRVNSLNYNPLQYISQSSAASAATSGSATQASASSGSAAPTPTSFVDQLALAITNAIENVQQSGNTSNLDSSLQTAVNQVFQNNGIAPPSNLDSTIQNAVNQFEANGVDSQAAQQQAAGQTEGGRHHHHHGDGVGESSGANASPQSSAADSLAAALNQANGTSSASGAQPASSQLFADLFLQIAGSSGSSNQSVSGFMLDVQT